MTDYLARLDVVERLFRAATGMLAPGKDYPSAMHPPDPQERQRAWESWNNQRAYRDAIGRIVELESALAMLEDESDGLNSEIIDLRAQLAASKRGPFEGIDHPSTATASTLAEALANPPRYTEAQIREANRLPAKDEPHNPAAFDLRGWNPGGNMPPGGVLP